MQRRKIDAQLSPAHRLDFEGLALDQSVSLDKLWWWLRTHGYKIGRSSVARWRGTFRAEAADPVRRLRKHLHSWIEMMSADQLQAIFDQLSSRFGGRAETAD